MRNSHQAVTPAHSHISLANSRQDFEATHIERAKISISRWVIDVDNAGNALRYCRRSLKGQPIQFKHEFDPLDSCEEDSSLPGRNSRIRALL